MDLGDVSVFVFAYRDDPRPRAKRRWLNATVNGWGGICDI